MVVGQFTSLAHEEDFADYKKDKPGLEWELGFEEAIKKAAQHPWEKEHYIKSLIDYIEVKNMLEK